MALTEGSTNRTNGQVPEHHASGATIGKIGSPEMTSEQFKAWRKSLGLSQKAAADALGLKNRIVQYYEKGERDGEEVKIPKYIRLACFALTSGRTDYKGPETASSFNKTKKSKKKEKSGTK